MRRKVVKQGDGAPKRSSRASGATSAWARLPLVGKILLPISALTLSVVIVVAVFFTSAEVTKDRVTQAVEGRAIAITMRGALAAVPDDPSTVGVLLRTVSSAYTNVAALCVLTVNHGDPLGPLVVYASAGPPSACDPGSPLVSGVGMAGVVSGERQTAAGNVEETATSASFSSIGKAAVVLVQVRLTPVTEVAATLFQKIAISGLVLAACQTALVYGILWVSALGRLKQLQLKASAAARTARRRSLEGVAEEDRSGDEIHELSLRFDDMLDAVRDRELELVESHDKLETLISNSPVIVFSTDREGMLLQIQGNDVGSMATQLGIDTLEGHNLLEIVQHNAGFARLVREALTGEKVREVIAVSNWKTAASQVPLHLDLLITPNFDTDGRLIGTTGLAVDVSDQLDAVSARAESQQKSAFLAAMSHELRTPLNSIMGFSQLLEMPASKAGLTTKQRRYVEHIYSSGEHLLALVSDILDLAKVGAGQMEVNLEVVAVHDQVKDPVEKMRPIALDKGLTIEMDIPVELLSFTDRLRVRQILLNLLTNAVKFTLRNGGPIKVTGRTSGDGIEIAVADSGIGIALAEQVRIFEEFTQVDRGPSRRLDGTGLGLALTKRMAELMGGNVRVESALGRGSTFTVWLPGAQAGIAAPPLPAALAS